VKATPFLFFVSSISAGHFNHTSHYPELLRHHPFNRRTAAGPAKTAPPQNISSATTTTTIAAIALAAVDIAKNGSTGSTNQSGSDATISTTPVRVTNHAPEKRPTAPDNKVPPYHLRQFPPATFSLREFYFYYSSIRRYPQVDRKEVLTPFIWGECHG
jgi:hypothetical protein